MKHYSVLNTIGNLILVQFKVNTHLRHISHVKTLSNKLTTKKESRHSSSPSFSTKFELFVGFSAEMTSAESFSLKPFKVSHRTSQPFNNTYRKGFDTVIYNTTGLNVDRILHNESFKFKVTEFMLKSQALWI